MITVIRRARIVDGRSSEPQDDAAIVINAGRITEIERDSAVRVPSGAITIDAGHRTVLPGLMDMHTHIHIPINPYESGSTELEPNAESIASAAAHAVHNARSYVAKGVTTIRDVGSHSQGIFAIKRLIDTGRLPGPRIIPCGRAIAMTGGHALFLGAEADGVDAVRRAARAELKAGALALKIMASGAAAEGGESPFEVQYTEKEIAAATREAHAQGRTAAAHAVNSEAATNAIRAGVDSIEHGVLLDDATLDLMAERGVTLVPTVWTFQMTAGYGGHYGTEPWVVEEVRTRIERHLEVVAYAHRRGVAIAVGTDSAIPINPVDSIFWELAWLRHCGLTPGEAIAAATSVAARLIGMDDELGTIEVGRIADLLIVDGDPLLDVMALKNTVHVLQAGEIVVHDGRLIRDGIMRESSPAPGGPLPPTPEDAPA